MPRFCLLEDTAAIAVRGPDATTFLNAQLSRDVPPFGAAATSAPLAGWHDARGRVRALFRVLPLDDGYLLITDRAMLATVLGSLPKYVLRARVTVAEAADWRFAAIVDADDQWCADFLLAPPGRHWLVHREGFAFVGVGAGLVHVAARGAQIETLGNLFGMASAPATAGALAAIRAGLPTITPAVSERFVAQMLNLDTLDAVSFSKGCYPGQEIIARLRYRGEVKRRLKRFIASGDELPAPGRALVDAHGAHVGDVISSARSESGIELLAVADTVSHEVRTTTGGVLVDPPV